MHKVIYGISIDALKSAGIDQIDIGCREILEQTNHPITIIGPQLEEEGMEVFTMDF